MFLKLILTALLAVSTENLLFLGGMGFSRSLRSAQRPDSIAVYSLLVTWFTLISMLAGIWLDPLLSFYGIRAVLRSAGLAAASAAAYLVTSVFVRLLFPMRAKKKILPILAPAAINTVVLSMPYLQRSLVFDLVQSVGYALGTGLAFYLASVILAHAEVKCGNPDMPEAFSGLPASILYVGILSMAFAGFSGGRVF